MTLTSQSPVDYVDVSIIHIYFVVQFYPWLNFYFGYFFFSMPFITIQKNKGKNLTSDRIEPQHVHAVVQFYPWFKFHFLFFYTHYTLPYTKAKENKN